MRLLVDLSNLAYRAAHKLKLSHRGKKTHIIYGVLKSLESLVADTRPEEVVICWDGMGGSQKRKDIYKPYKENRKRDPEFMEDLHRQLDCLWSFLETLPVVQCREYGVEADDIIIILNRFLRHERIGIVTPDSDLFQLATPEHVIIDPRTHEAVRLDLEPSQYLTYRVLVGGKDNVPGVARVGDKKARKLIAEFGSIDDILDHAREADGLGSMGWEEAREVVLRNLAIWDAEFPKATIEEKRTLLDQYKYGRLKARFDVDRFLSLCREHGLSSFVRGISRLKGIFKRLVRNKRDETRKANQEGQKQVGEEDSESSEYVRRIRIVEGSHGKSQREEGYRGEADRVRKRGDAKGVGSESSGKHRHQKPKDGFVRGIRKTVPHGTVTAGRHESTSGAIRSTKPGAKDRAEKRRDRGIDFSDPRLHPSEGLQSSRSGRRQKALFILSTFSSREGDEWIEQQTTKKLRFVQRMIMVFEGDEEYEPTKKELRGLQVLYNDYLNEEPDWMKHIPC
jgi:5'-3' exonuclease